MEKKNPFITTVGFKKDDPEHVYVAELLNSMGRGKAQYIVKAVMVYQKWQQNGKVTPSVGNSFDYARIRSIVYQVLEEKEQQNGSLKLEQVVMRQEKSEQKEEVDLLSVLDDNTVNGILASIAAFQEQ